MTVITLSQVVAHTQCQEELPPGKASYPVEDVNTLEEATPHHVTFFNAVRSKDILAKTQAGACFVKPLYASWVPDHTVPLLTKDPYKAFIQLAHLFMPPQKPFVAFHHPTAHIHPSASVHSSSILSPGVVIEEGAQIGYECFIGPYAVIGPHVVIGTGCHIGSHSSLYHAHLGNNISLQSGVRIGEEGFGFLWDGNQWLDVPHKGKVIIHDDVHIGANCSIARGSFKNTMIGRGARLDAMVHIGHNVILEPWVVIAAQCGISGSCVIKKGCQLGGQVGLAPHVTLAEGTQVGAKSGVMKSSLPGQRLMGIPAEPSASFWRKKKLS